MMVLSKLPEDIALLVLKRAAFLYIHELGRWNDSLVLLSVCRTWRLLGIPLIYSGVYIQHREVSNNFIAHSTPRNVVLTNLDLVSATGNAAFVKYVDISIVCQLLPFDGFKTALNLLKCVLPEWPHVKKLAIGVEYLPRKELIESSVEEPSDIVSNLVDMFNNVLPGVQKLIMSDHVSTNTHFELYESLATTYAGQLRILDSSQIIHSLNSQTFARLKSLSLQFTTNDYYQVPHLYIEPLEHILLTNIPSLNIWLESNTSRYVFENLKQLGLEYTIFDHDELDIDAYQTKLHFPKLRSLTVDCMYNYCPVLANSVFPLHLDKLDIVCSTPICQLVGKLNFQKLKNTRLQVNCHTDEIPTVLPIANRIFKATVGTKEATFIINNGSVNAVLCAQWPLRSCLQIMLQVTSREMLLMICRFPRLNKLMLYNLVIGEVNDLVIPSVESNNRLSPLQTQVQCIMLQYQDSSTSVEHAIAVIKYLVVRIPSLKRIVAWQVPLGLLSQFIDEYKIVYPHLEAIEFSAVAD